MSAVNNPAVGVVTGDITIISMPLISYFRFIIFIIFSSSFSPFSSFHAAA